MKIAKITNERNRKDKEIFNMYLLCADHFQICAEYCYRNNKVQVFIKDELKNKLILVTNMHC